MRLARDIAVGVAAGAIFAVAQYYLFPLDTAWKWTGIATVFLLGLTMAALTDSSWTNKERPSVMSHTRTKGNLDAVMRGAVVETDGDADIMSGNIVDGDASYTIENTEIRRS